MQAKMDALNNVHTRRKKRCTVGQCDRGGEGQKGGTVRVGRRRQPHQGDVIDAECGRGKK